MGLLVDLHERRGVRRTSRPGARATLYFDLASPETYLAAEQAEALFGRALCWRAACAQSLHGGAPPVDRARVAERARALRLPLIWPSEGLRPVPAAMRVSALAAEQGRAGAFVLAAGRLAFCGGFHVDEPDILAEAAAAAGLELGDALRAAGDVARDGAIESHGLRLLARGADRLPALAVGARLFAGEDRLAEGASLLRARGAAGLPT